MKLRGQRILLALFLLTLPTWAQQNRVVIISIDGLKGTTLASLPERALKTPNLNEIVAKGAISAGLEGVVPTVTYPSHTTLVTGRSPAAHGILGNAMFDPESKLNGAWYWYAEQIKTPTLWDVAHAKGLITAAVSWPVSVGARIDFNFPEYRPQRNVDDLLSWRASVTPGLLNEFEKSEGEVTLTNQTDRQRAAMAAFLIRTYKPHLLLVHLLDVDHEEHSFGPDAPEALLALEGNDVGIGMIRDAVRAAGLDQETTFIVTSDHGFRPVEKALHPQAVLAALGLTAPDGAPDKWRVGVHPNAASFALNVHDSNDTEAIELATKTFERLHAEGNWGIAKVASRHDLEEARGYTGSFLAVAMASGFTVGSAKSGPWLTSSGSLRGNHGFWPGPIEMDAALAVMGPSIPANKLPRARLVDVAPTAAAILGIDLGSSVEGRDLLSSVR